MKLLVMTAPTFFVEEDRLIAELFAQGMDFMHLLKPNASRALIERLLRLLPSDVLESTIIHGYSNFKDEYSLAGVNIEGNTPSPSWWRRGKVTRTCTSVEQLAAAKKQADWVILDGVGGRTINKKMPAFSRQQLEHAAEEGLIGKRVYALGDITPDNMPLVRELGFGGVVLSESLWNSFDIHSDLDFSRLMAFYQRCKELV